MLIKIKIKIKIISILIFSLSTIGYANKQPSLVVMLSGGPGWTFPGKNQTIFLQEDADYYYRNLSKTQPIGFAEIFIGFQQSVLNESMKTQWGIAASGSGMAKVGGQVWQFSDPEFYNLNYTYNANQFRLALRTKWIAEKPQLLKPYITGSIGVGFNRSYSYTETALIEEVVVGPPFNNHLTTAFSYTAGCGLQKSVGDHLYAGIGYEFIDWGGSRLNRAFQQTINDGLRMPHLYMYTFLMSLTYAV